MPRVIVLGTGTNVGKTYVSRALALALKALRPELTVAALKPIESGVAADAGSESDARVLARVAGGLKLPEPHPLFAFRDPVSPHLAARRAGSGPIEVGAVAAWLAGWENSLAPHVTPSHIWSIIETAGALFSPLSPVATNFELAVSLEPALWVLVAPDALGVLHDVRVTWEACARRGRVPDHLLLCASRVRDESTGTNAGELRTLRIAEPTQCLGRDALDVSLLAGALLDSQQGRAL